MGRLFQQGSSASLEGIPFYKIFTESTTWTVPQGLNEVDVFLVGGGGGGSQYFNGVGNGCGGNGGSGYTKTFKKDTSGWKDGSSIAVNPGSEINIVVGLGGVAQNGSATPVAGDGGYSEFMDSSYRAEGGKASTSSSGGDGGTGGSGRRAVGAIDGSDGLGQGGSGQGHTTRLFGEKESELYANGGGFKSTSAEVRPIPGSGNGGHTIAGSNYISPSAGSSGCVIVRGIKYL